MTPEQAIEFAMMLKEHFELSEKPEVKLQCDMHEECRATITHIDDSGFIYCASHGKFRKQSRRCRKLKPSELKLIQSGKPVTRY